RAQEADGLLLRRGRLHVDGGADAAEEFTALRNEYLTEMSASATAHGGTVNKFIGDAILVFFGDPDSRGAVEDAKACLTMALDMQRRTAELKVQWRQRGIAEPFRARMGI